MTTQRRRQIFAQRRRAALDPSGAAGSGPAATTPPPPVSREAEERAALIWTPPSYEEDQFSGPSIDVGNLHMADGTRQNIEAPAAEVWTPASDPTAAPMVKKRKTLRLRKDR